MVNVASYADQAKEFRCAAAECRKRGTTAQAWCVRLAHMRLANSFFALATDMESADALGMGPPDRR